MSNISNSVLAEIEWDEGLSMPVANADNKALENEVQKKQSTIVACQGELSETEDRIIAMVEHLKNVRQELQHTQSLVGARGKEAETEEHLLKIAEREEGRLKQEIARLKKEMDELKEKKNSYENNIFKQTQKLEELKSQMNWDQQALEAWLEESARKDEDAMTIQKYTRQDESKIKELSLRMEKLMQEAMNKKNLLDNEMTNTLTSQIELDKIAEDFRKAHMEREELLSQWENTIEQMQRRDREMDVLASKLAKAKQEVRRHNDIIREKQQFLENEMENNQEQEKRISAAERTSTRLRADQQEMESQRQQFENELATLKRTVDRTAMDLEAARASVANLKKEVAHKQLKLKASIELREALVEKLKVAAESTLSAEERSLHMEEILEDEEKHQRELRSQLKQLGEIVYRKNKEVQDVRAQEKMTEAQIDGAHNTIKNLGSKISRLDTDALKQQEILYSQDFTLQNLERRCTRMLGDSNTEEKTVLEAKIRQLQDELDKKTQTQQLLQLQLKRVQDDLRCVTRSLDQSHAEKDDLTVKIDELHLYNDSSEAELKKIIKNKQNIMVDENLLKLEIKKLRDLLMSRADDVMSLEKRKLQLDTAMKERHQEINIHKEMLTAQVKATDEERQQISAELHERISKIDKLKKRYEILMVSMAPPEGEEEKSQAYYVIKAAQEKEELQREGDDLDAKIRKAEKEIRALENTLKLMNGRNEQYRKSFNKITESSDEMDEKRQLDEQMRAVMDKFKYKRRQIRELQDDLHTMSSTLDNLNRDEGAYVGMIEDKKNKLLQLNKEIEDQRAKLERVAKQNVRLSRELRSAKKAKEEVPEEKDFEVREMREFNKSVTKLVGEAAVHYPEMEEAVSMYFTQANLPVPTAGGVPVSSRGSARSSAGGTPASSVRSGGSRGSPRAVNIGFDGPGSARSSASSNRSQASSRR
ncbi:coiled-coil domain-containing protein 39 [Plakobranchus ocellatus]|uniref:Coiled-coil domain-containing protein 39 n=1 Tax=Plakobranchus ocellatus TaxID=259542 RepID=A0AAV4BQ50_9GAST|nr:coiled-coil domain-containing protein 39 [Plakobranchus ocellatus]